jgi:hypothetical protein
MIEKPCFKSKKGVRFSLGISMPFKRFGKKLLILLFLAVSLCELSEIAKMFLLFAFLSSGKSFDE